MVNLDVALLEQAVNIHRLYGVSAFALLLAIKLVLFELFSFDCANDVEVLSKLGFAFFVVVAKFFLQLFYFAPFIEWA